MRQILPSNYSFLEKQPPASWQKQPRSSVQVLVLAALACGLSPAVGFILQKTVQQTSFFFIAGCINISIQKYLKSLVSINRQKKHFAFFKTLR